MSSLHKAAWTRIKMFVPLNWQPNANYHSTPHSWYSCITSVSQGQKICKYIRKILWNLAGAKIMWPAGSAANAMPECQRPVKPSNRLWKSGWLSCKSWWTVRSRSPWTSSDYLQRYWRSRNSQWKRSGIADISTDYAALFSGIKNPYGAPSKLSVSFCFLICQSFAAMIYYQRNFRRPRPFWRAAERKALWLCVSMWPVLPCLRWKNM